MALCGSAKPAQAQPGSESDALKHARDQFAQALALQTAGDWASALTLLKEVLAVRSTPQVRFNIALCEERLGRLVAALGDYELAAADAPSDKTDLVRQEVEARLEALKARLPRVVVERGEGAESASISLDGVPLGDAVLGLQLPADPGPHVVEASAKGFLDFKMSFRVAEQQTANVRVTLQPEPLTAALPPKPAPHYSAFGVRGVGYVIGGAGLASLAASGAMFYLRYTTLNDLDRQCGSDRMACPDSARNTVDRGALYTTLGNVTLAVGALGLGAGVALVIVGGHSSSVALAPGAVGANAGGASLLGKF